MGPANQKTLEESGKGLWVGAPQGASAAMAVEGRRGRGSGGFPQEYKCGERSVSGGGEAKDGRGQSGSRGPGAGDRGGQARPTQFIFLSFFPWYDTS